MSKGLFIAVFSSVCFIFSPQAEAETITLSTYYPAPYGEYEDLYIGSTTDATTDVKSLTVESRGFAGIYLKGDTANTSGEPGGAFLRLSQDAGAVTGILGIVNIAGRDGSTETYTNTLGNSLLLGHKHNSALHLGTNNAVRMTILGNGYVGIALTNPTYRLQLPNTASVAGRGQASSWVTYSSIRYKDNVSEVSGTEAIDKIMALNPVSFYWKESGKKDIGFIAEDVATVVPEAVQLDGAYADGLSITQIVTYLTKVVQEQQKQIASQQYEIESLKKDLVKIRDSY
jgi:hypothetical protein